MATRRVGRSRGSLGHVPLSSGEIELYSRQDELARRRRRLLLVRDQERRLAQQVTQRYRDNLSTLQRSKSDRVQRAQSSEHQALLTALHERYTRSLQRMGTAQRNARLKLVELQEQARDEKVKWAYNRRIVGKARVMEATEAQKGQAELRTAKRRLAMQKRARVTCIGSNQRLEASAWARREEDGRKQRASERVDRKRLHAMQSVGHVLAEPRRREKEVVAFQYTRLHCLASTPRVERPAVTVVRHYPSSLTAMRGKEAAKQLQSGLAMKRARDVVIKEAREERAVARGQAARESVARKEQGQQAVEWLAIVDQRARRARGLELGQVEGPWRARGEGAGDEDVERRAAQEFARLLGLEEGSMELSEFSIETEDEVVGESVPLGLTEDEKVMEAETKVIRLNAMNDEDGSDECDRVKDRCVGPTATDQQDGVTQATSFLPNATRDLTREQLRKRKAAQNAIEKSDLCEGFETPLKLSGGNAGERLETVKNEKDLMDDEAPHGRQIETCVGQMGGNLAAVCGQGRPSHGEKHSDGTSSEADDEDCASNWAKSNDSVIAQEGGDGTHDDFDVHNLKPQVHETERKSLLSNSKLNQLVNQFEEIAAGTYQREKLSSRVSDASDDTGDNTRAKLVTTNERDRSLGLKSLAKAGHQRTLSVNEASSALDDNDFQDEDLRRSLLDSSVATSLDENVSLRDQSFADEKVDPDGKVARDGQDVISPDVVVDSKRVSDHHSECSNGPLSYTLRRYNEKHECDESEYEEHEVDINGSSGAPLSKEGLADVQTNSNSNQSSLSSHDRDVDRLPNEQSQQNDSNFLKSNDGSQKRHDQSSVDERIPCLASRLSTFSVKKRYSNRTVDAHDSRAMTKDDDARSVSESSFSPRQRSLSHLDQMVNTRSTSFQQRYIKQHITSSFSSSDGQSEDGDENSEHEGQRMDPRTRHDPYTQQMHHHARRSSVSAVSIAQYSLPPSDSQSSFTDSLNGLPSEKCTDSFVNELVPIFPTRALPQPSRSVPTRQEAETYDVQLLEPNMSRMLTKERLALLERSRHGVDRHETLPDRSSRVAASARARHEQKNEDSRLVDKRLSYDRGQSLSGSLDSVMDANRANLQKNDDRSDISSRSSGMSSLGFTVQLHLAAGTTRHRENEGSSGASTPRANQDNNHRPLNGSITETNEVAEHSFASSSSVSIDAHVDYVANMTSTVAKALPLHLCIPALMHGKKDMTKPPAPITWPQSPVSASSKASDVDDNDATDRKAGSLGESVARSDSSESGLNALSSSQSSLLPDAPCSSSDQERFLNRSSSTSSSDAPHATSKTGLQVPPPPFESLDRRQRPHSMQNRARLPADARSSPVQQSNATWSFDRHLFPPRPMTQVDMMQPPPPVRPLCQDGQDLMDGNEEERKHEDGSSDSGVSPRHAASSTNASVSSRRPETKKAETFEVCIRNSQDDAGDENGMGLSLAEAFQRRHPHFRDQVARHRAELKRQRTKGRDAMEQPPSRGLAAKRDAVPLAQRELLHRLTSGTRADLSPREMRERSRRLYHQLPEVVERKRQEQVLQRRRARLNELRDQEQKRRLDSKQRRQQQRNE